MTALLILCILMFGVGDIWSFHEENTSKNQTDISVEQSVDSAKLLSNFPTHNRKDNVITELHNEPRDKLSSLTQILLENPDVIPGGAIDIEASRVNDIFKTSADISQDKTSEFDRGYVINSPNETEESSRRINNIEKVSNTLPKQDPIVNDDKVMWMTTTSSSTGDAHDSYTGRRFNEIKHIPKNVKELISERISKENTENQSIGYTTTSYATTHQMITKADNFTKIHNTDTKVHSNGLKNTDKNDQDVFSERIFPEKNEDKTTIAIYKTTTPSSVSPKSTSLNETVIRNSTINNKRIGYTTTSYATTKQVITKSDNFTKIHETDTKIQSNGLKNIDKNDQDIFSERIFPEKTEEKIDETTIAIYKTSTPFSVSPKFTSSVETVIRNNTINNKRIGYTTTSYATTKQGITKSDNFTKIHDTDTKILRNGLKHIDKNDQDIFSERIFPEKTEDKIDETTIVIYKTSTPFSVSPKFTSSIETVIRNNTIREKQKKQIQLKGDRSETEGSENIIFEKFFSVAPSELLTQQPKRQSINDFQKSTDTEPVDYKSFIRTSENESKQFLNSNKIRDIHLNEDNVSRTGLKSRKENMPNSKTIQGLSDFTAGSKGDKIGRKQRKATFSRNKTAASLSIQERRRLHREWKEKMKKKSNSQPDHNKKENNVRHENPKYEKSIPSQRENNDRDSVVYSNSSVISTSNRHHLHHKDKSLLIKVSTTEKKSDILVKFQTAGNESKDTKSDKFNQVNLHELIKSVKSNNKSTPLLVNPTQYTRTPAVSAGTLSDQSTARSQHLQNLTSKANGIYASNTFNNTESKATTVADKQLEIPTQNDHKNTVVDPFPTKSEFKEPVGNILLSQNTELGFAKDFTNTNDIAETSSPDFSFAFTTSTFQKSSSSTEGAAIKTSKVSTVLPRITKDTEHKIDISTVRPIIDITTEQKTDIVTLRPIFHNDTVQKPDYSTTQPNFVIDTVPKPDFSTTQPNFDIDTVRETSMSMNISAVPRFGIDSEQQPHITNILPNFDTLQKTDSSTTRSNSNISSDRETDISNAVLINDIDNLRSTDTSTTQANFYTDTLQNTDISTVLPNDDIDIRKTDIFVSKSDSHAAYQEPGKPSMSLLNKSDETFLLSKGNGTRLSEDFNDTSSVDKTIKLHDTENLSTVLTTENSSFDLHEVSDTDTRGNTAISNESGKILNANDSLSLKAVNDANSTAILGQHNDKINDNKFVWIVDIDGNNDKKDVMSFTNNSFKQGTNINPNINHSQFQDKNNSVNLKNSDTVKDSDYIDPWQRIFGTLADTHNYPNNTPGSNKNDTMISVNGSDPTDSDIIAANSSDISTGVPILAKHFSTGYKNTDVTTPETFSFSNSFDYYSPVGKSEVVTDKTFRNFSRIALQAGKSTTELIAKWNALIKEFRKRNLNNNSQLVDFLRKTSNEEQSGNINIEPKVGKTHNSNRQHLKPTVEWLGLNNGNVQNRQNVPSLDTPNAHGHQIPEILQQSSSDQTNVDLSENSKCKEDQSYKLALNVLQMILKNMDKIQLPVRRKTPRRRYLLIPLGPETNTETSAHEWSENSHYNPSHFQQTGNTLFEKRPVPYRVYPQYQQSSSSFK